MLREQAQIWATMDAIERELRDGGNGFYTCRRLTIELQHHNLKEKWTLYPQADLVLTPTAAERLRESSSRPGNCPRDGCAASTVTIHSGREGRKPLSGSS